MCICRYRSQLNVAFCVRTIYITKAAQNNISAKQPDKQSAPLCLSRKLTSRYRLEHGNKRGLHDKTMNKMCTIFRILEIFSVWLVSQPIRSFKWRLFINGALMSGLPSSCWTMSFWWKMCIWAAFSHKHVSVLLRPEKFRSQICLRGATWTSKCCVSHSFSTQAYSCEVEALTDSSEESQLWSPGPGSRRVRWGSNGTEQRHGLLQGSLRQSLKKNFPWGL